MVMSGQIKVIKFRFLDHKNAQPMSFSVYSKKEVDKGSADDGSERRAGPTAL